MRILINEEKELDDYLKLKNYSARTRKSYVSALHNFLRWLRVEDRNDPLSLDAVRAYLLYRYDQQRKWQTINNDYSALLHFFKNVRKLEWDIEKVPRPRTDTQLPRILSKFQVEQMIQCTVSVKHRAFICLLYGAGLRLSEACALHIDDINGDRKQLLVRAGKGATDRYVDVPECLLDVLRFYYLKVRPSTYLFNGQKKAQGLSASAGQSIVRLSGIRAGISRRVSPHILRHCYATHHLENGTDLIYLKKQMGHKNLKTTARYIHLITDHSWRIVHPLADIQIGHQL